MNSTIQYHLEAKRLEQRAATEAEVLAFWDKALTASRDASNRTSSLESRLLRAYDAGRLAALAIVRSAGYRTRGGDSHHYVTFHVAGSVVSDPELRRALGDMDGLRQARHALEYEAYSDVDEETVARAARVLEQVLRFGATHLREQRPALGQQIRSR